jgi:hypothetical protein
MALRTMTMRALAMAIGEVLELIEATTWLEKYGDRVVSTSAWASEESFQQAMPVNGAAFGQWPQRASQVRYG